MNPYLDPDVRQEIIAMQLAVNAASQAACSAERNGDPDAEDLRQEWRDLNIELEQYIQTARNTK